MAGHLEKRSDYFSRGPGTNIPSLPHRPLQWPWLPLPRSAAVLIGRLFKLKLAVKLGMFSFGSDHLHYLFVLETGSHVAQAGF